MILECKYINWFGISGIALGFFAIVNDKKNASLVNHERIHIVQQWELLIIGFILFYFGQYIYFRIQGINHYRAYRTLWHEREAKKYESDFNYLKTRNLYSFCLFKIK